MLKSKYMALATLALVVVGSFGDRAVGNPGKKKQQQQQQQQQQPAAAAAGAALAGMDPNQFQVVPCINNPPFLCQQPYFNADPGNQELLRMNAQGTLLVLRNGQLTPVGDSVVYQYSLSTPNPKDPRTPRFVQNNQQRILNGQYLAGTGGGYGQGQYGYLPQQGYPGGGGFQQVPGQGVFGVRDPAGGLGGAGLPQRQAQVGPGLGYPGYRQGGYGANGGPGVGFSGIQPIAGPAQQQQQQQQHAGTPARQTSMQETRRPVAEEVPARVTLFQRRDEGFENAGAMSLAALEKQTEQKEMLTLQQDCVSEKRPDKDMPFTLYFFNHTSDKGPEFRVFLARGEATDEMKQKAKDQSLTLSEAGDALHADKIDDWTGEAAKEVYVKRLAGTDAQGHPAYAVKFVNNDVEYYCQAQGARGKADVTDPVAKRGMPNPAGLARATASMRR